MSKKLVSGAVIAVAGLAVANPITTAVIGTVGLVGTIGAFIYQKLDKDDKLNLQKFQDMEIIDKCKAIYESAILEKDNYKNLYETEKRKNNTESSN